LKENASGDAANTNAPDAKENAGGLSNAARNFWGG
jgi:hypothetical protein